MTQLNDESLLVRLRHAATKGDYYSDWMDEAADRIEELERELAGLQRTLDGLLER